jgi:hypothetical protein
MTEADLQRDFQEIAEPGICEGCGGPGPIALCLTAVVGHLPKEGDVMPDEQIALSQMLCFACFEAWRVRD